MPFNLQHLQAGVLYWRNTNWPQDFHNQFYIDLAGHNEMGLFTGDWWPGILQTLSSWRATWPRSFDFINERALERLNLLQELWVPVNDLPNDIIAIPEDAIQRVNPFINVIHEIKNVNSPVFTSKFCHFISPKRFPVIDRKAMGLPFGNYIEYWQYVRDEWDNTENDVRNDLIQHFAHEIGDHIFDGYPFYTKIAEICLIGRNNG